MCASSVHPENATEMLSSEIEDFDQTLTKLEFGHIPIFLIISM